MKRPEEQNQQHERNEFDERQSLPETTAVACPFCGSADVELLALFGSQLLTDQYYCRACRTPFEHLRADEDGWQSQAG
jgi:ring-1,2-phenylacetyl-CoA epoxidase subunit PaaD